MSNIKSINIQPLHKQFLQTRHLVLKVVEHLSLAQLNTIPEGFTNNIAWHLGHILVTQQLLCYKFSELEMRVSTKLIEQFMKGTHANKAYSQNEIDEIKNQLLELVAQFEQDFDKGLFQTYNPYQTSTGVVLNDIYEAFQFNLYHEGIHLGMILSMKHLI